MADTQDEQKSQRERFQDDPANADFLRRRREDLLRAATPQGDTALTERELEKAREAQAKRKR